LVGMLVLKRATSFTHRLPKPSIEFCYTKHAQIL
jgi:hypothetical protein